MDDIDVQKFDSNSPSPSSFGHSPSPTLALPNQQFGQTDFSGNALGLDLGYSRSHHHTDPFHFASQNRHGTSISTSSIMTIARPRYIQYGFNRAQLMEIIRTASHENLIEARNVAYMAAIVKINALESEKKIYKESFSLLLNKLSPAVPTTTTLNAKPQPGGPPLPNANSTLLKREDYPDVPFWTRKNWKAFRENIRDAGSHTDDALLGKSKQRSKPSRTLAYITDSKGVGVDGYQATAIRATCRQIWTTLANKSYAPSTWSKATITAVQFYRQHMYQAHPDLRLCEGHWKVDLLATDNYSTWSRTRKEKVGTDKEKAKASLGDSSSTTTFEINKRPHESCLSVARKRRKIAAADDHPAPSQSMSDLETASSSPPELGPS